MACEIVRNQQVNGQSTYKRAAPIWHAQSVEPPRIHMVIAGLDYKYTRRPLTCTSAAKSVEELARQCGVQWLIPLYEEDCTKEAVLRAVKQLASKCGPNDFFIFYFAGHGSGAEDFGGTSHAFVLLDKHGEVSASTLLPGDELTGTVQQCAKKDTRILFLVDTCFSGPLVDLSKEGWGGRHAVSVTGTQDPNTSEEDRGAICSHALLLAIDKLSKVGRDNYSAGMLFNAILHENDLVFDSKQDLVIQSAPSFSPDALAWPLVPTLGYQAPLSRCAGPGGLRNDLVRGAVSPALLQHVRQESLNIPVSIEEYVALVMGQDMFHLKPCRACNAGCATGTCIVQ